MLFKIVFLVTACAVTINSFVINESSEDKKWMGGTSQTVEKPVWSGNWGSQGKRDVLDSSSRSGEGSDDLDSSRGLEIMHVEKVYHRTNPEEAGNGRLVFSHSGSTLKRFPYSDSQVGEFNRITKD